MQIEVISDPTGNAKRMVKREVHRLDDLRKAESKRIAEIIVLRAEFAAQLTLAEAKRIDAIRAVDVAAVSVAAERAAAQAAVLASQVTATADTLRKLVEATAATQATQQDQLAKQLTERLGLLERAQYEGVGKAGVEDPMLAVLRAEVKELRDIATTGVGKQKGLSLAWAIIAGAVMIVGAIIASVTNLI